MSENSFTLHKSLDDTKVSTSGDSMTNQMNESLFCRELTRYLATWRVDFSYAVSDIQVIDIADKDEGVFVVAPSWMKKDGRSGMIVKGREQSGTFSLIAHGAGVVTLFLRGESVSSKDGGRVPCRVEYSSVKINGKEMLSDHAIVFHDKPRQLIIDIEKEKVVRIDVQTVHYKYARKDLLKILLSAKFSFPIDTRNVDKILAKNYVQRFLEEQKKSIEDEFFVIDTRCLEYVVSRFYGYGVTCAGIVEEGNYRSFSSLLDGNGCYVDVCVRGRTVVISQDAMGSYGLYFYRDKSGWCAISNSMMKLTEMLAKEVHLSINHDYLKHLISCNLCSLSYSDTAINEIMLLDKDDVVSIDMESGAVRFNRAYWHANELEIGSAEGIAVLDAWYEKWSAIIANLYLKTDNIRADLTGGFDSRMSLVPLLGSHVPLDKIEVYSNTSKLHTFEEDYEIASNIITRVGGALNAKKFAHGATNMSLTEIVKTIRYLKMGFNREMYFHTCKYARRRFRITGGAGELLREHWSLNNGVQAYFYQKLSNGYSEKMKGEIGDAVKRILSRSELMISSKYRCYPVMNEDMARYMYQETRCRNHFGKSAVEDYLSNCIILMPLADPLLQQLKQKDRFCSDRNLLAAVIYSRYYPQLIDVKFDSGRKLSSKCVTRASEICSQFPYVAHQTKRFDFAGANFDIPCESEVDAAKPEEYFERMIQSQGFKDFVKSEFDETVYEEACSYRKTIKYHPMARFYALIGAYYAAELAKNSK